MGLRHPAGSVEGRDGVEAVREEEDGGRGPPLDWLAGGRRLGRLEGSLEGEVCAEGPGRAREADRGPVGAHDFRLLDLLADVAAPPVRVMGRDIVAVGAEDRGATLGAIDGEGLRRRGVRVVESAGIAETRNGGYAGCQGSKASRITRHEPVERGGERSELLDRLVDDVGYDEPEVVRGDNRHALASGQGQDERLVIKLALKVLEAFADGSPRRIVGTGEGADRRASLMAASEKGLDELVGIDCAREPSLVHNQMSRVIIKLVGVGGLTSPLA